MAVTEGAAGSLGPLPPSRRPSVPVLLSPEQEAALHGAREFMDIFVTLTQGRLASRELPTTIRVLEETAFKHISALLQDQGQLCLEIGPREVLLWGHSVHLGEAGPGFTGQLYNDGIRQVILLQGLSFWEFNELIVYLRSSGPRTGLAEVDSVTFFWESSWSHIVPLVVDPLEAGLISPPRGTACVLSHGNTSPAPPADHGNSSEQSSLETFLKIVGEKASVTEPEGLPQISDIQLDLWRRGFSLALRLMEEKGGGDPITVAVMGRVARQLERESWAELSCLGEEIFRSLGREASSEQRWRATSMRDALGKVFDGERFQALARVLPDLSFTAFKQLGKLLLVLPRQADAELLELMNQLGRGASAFHLLAIFYKRGMEVDWLFQECLGDPDEARALLAMESMSDILSKPALAALSHLIGHASPKVRDAAIETLGPWLGGDAAPHMIKNLDLARPRDVEAIICLLEGLPSRTVSKQLLPLIKRGRLERLAPEHRDRLYRILVRSDDAESANYLMRQIVKVNLAMGPAGHIARREVLDAVVKVGEDPALSILTKALEQVLLPGHRDQLKTALACVKDDLKKNA